MPISSSGLASRPSSRRARATGRGQGCGQLGRGSCSTCRLLPQGFGSEIYRSRLLGKHVRFARWLRRRSSSSRRARTGRRTTASASATCCAGAGHRVVFIVEESFAGTLEAKGFEERMMRLAPPPEEPEEPGQFWKDFIRETAPVFRKSTIEQLGELHPADLAGAGRRRALRGRAAGRDPRRGAAGRRRRGQRRRASRRSPRAAALGADRLLQPARGEGSGAAAHLLRAAARRPSEWDAFRVEYRRATASCSASFAEFCVERGAPPLPGARAHPRVALAEPVRLPARARLPRSQPLAPTWHNLRDERARDRRAVELPASSDGAARSSTSASARSARPTSP